MTSAVEIFNERPDKRAHTTAGIITAVFLTILLLVLWLYKIYTPIPPIPPDPEVITIEFVRDAAPGGTYQEMGGGSQGETGKPGSQVTPDDGKPTPTPTGAITSPNADGPHSDAHATPNAEPSVSAETQALLDKLKNKKTNTTIKIGGDGSGSPYSSGQGDKDGVGVGPNSGGIPGGGNGGGGMKSYRKIIFKPDIANPTQEEGVVAVIVRVNRDGDVTYAEVDPAHSTTGNPILKSTATQSAYKIKFDSDPDGPELLQLSVNINFTLTK